MKGRIGLDMDGVLYSWDRAVRRMISEEFGLDVPESTAWSFIKDFAGEKVWRWLWAHDGNVDRMFGTGFAYPGAITGSQELYDLADEVVILTSGPPGCELAKEAWLLNRGIPFDDFVRFDHGVSKMSVPCQVYIDDNPAVIEDLARYPRRTGILVDRPWNQEVEYGKNVVRAHGWSEIVARAEDILDTEQARR
jgi:hypothetical protein